VAATTLLLARHGETDWNRDGRFQGHADRPLNELGRRQAIELANRLGGDGVTAVYTSDLRRAHGTAAVIASRLDLPLHRHAGLREIDVGAWSGLTRDEIAERFPDSYGIWRAGGEPPEWETRAALMVRVGAAIIEIAAAQPPSSRIVAVGHGGTIRAAERCADVEPSWPIENCAVVELRVVDGVLCRGDEHPASTV